MNKLVFHLSINTLHISNIVFLLKQQQELVVV